MDRDTALSKIRKCLALSKSANENEAATALRQAQALMREFNLGEADLQMADIKEVPAKAASNARPPWELMLARLCCEAFGCDMYLSGHRVLSRSLVWTRVCTFVFVGVQPASDLASYAFSVLQRQCVKARMAHIRLQPRSCKQRTKIARGDAFAEGWVLAVHRLVERLAAGDAKHEELLLAYMDKNHPDLQEIRASRRALGQNIRDDQWRGMEAGQRAELHNAVGGRAHQELLS